MPTYAYACTECEHRFDIVQSFSDDSLTVCPQCGGRLRKLFNAVGVVFKGGGFYRTDSRAASSATTPAGGSSGSTSAGPGGSGGSGTGSEGSGSGSSGSSGGSTAASSTASASSGSSSTRD